MLLPTLSETEWGARGTPRLNTRRKIKADQDKGTGSEAGVDPSAGPMTSPKSYQEERKRPNSAPGARNLPSTYESNGLLSWVERPPGYAGRRRTYNHGDLDFAGGRNPLLHGR